MPPSPHVLLVDDHDGVRAVLAHVVAQLCPTATIAEAAHGAEALSLVGLGDHARDYPWRLSGGMAQRVQIARALAVQPSVLLMDEPFGALDAITKAALQDVLLEVQRKTGATIVFVTHDLDEAIYLSDRVVVVSGRPGAITLVVDTELPRTRDQLETRELSRYLAVRHLLGEELRHG